MADTGSRNVKISGFTLIELLIVIAIISILAAILFPVFARARENARRARCGSNLKQIAMGLAQYAGDYDERVCPPVSDSDGQKYYPDLLQPYIKSAQIFECPSKAAATATFNSSTGYPAYGMNILMTPGYYKGGIALSEMNAPSELLVLASNTYTAAPGYFLLWYQNVIPSAAYNGWNGSTPPPTADHFEGVNVLYADGHVKWQSLERLTSPPPTPAEWRLWFPSAP